MYFFCIEQQLLDQWSRIGDGTSIDNFPDAIIIQKVAGKLWETLDASHKNSFSIRAEAERLQMLKGIRFPNDIARISGIYYCSQ